MAEDPRLGAFLDQWARDQRDGVTIRSVHNRLTGHLVRYDADQQQNRDRLMKLETRDEARERQQSQNDLADAIAEGTGRHQTPMQGFTPAFGIPVPVELRKPDTPPPKSWWARDAFKIALKAGGPSVAALVIGWFGHAAATPAAPPAMASVETHPSTVPAPPPVAVATVEVPVITVSASASASAKRPPGKP